MGYPIIYRFLVWTACWCLPFLSVIGQGVHKTHPVWPDTLGSGSYSLTGPETGVLWDNGSTSLNTTGLSPGAHDIITFSGLVPLDTFPFQIEQLYWEFLPSMVSGPNGIDVTVYASIQYCGTSIWNYPSCGTEPDSVFIFLLQDGIPIDSLHPVSCTYTFFMFPGNPPGHTYQCLLEDRSACGGITNGPLLTAYSCANMTFQTNVVDAYGGLSNGSIEVIGLLPDTMNLLPLQPPFSGTLSLYSLPTYSLVGTVPGTTALWTGLAAGDHMLVFQPDSLCSSPSTVLTVGSSTGIVTAEEARPKVVLWPNPVSNALYWNGASPSVVRVLDVNGREVLRGPSVPPLAVTDLPSGLYVLDLGNGLRQRFAKDQ